MEPMKTVDMTGLGGIYEHTCQSMLYEAERFLAKTENMDFDFVREFRPPVNVPETPRARELEVIMRSAAGTAGMTGTQQDVVLGHLNYIHKHGRAKWVEFFEQRYPDRVFSWKGDVSDCPEEDRDIKVTKQELSEAETDERFRQEIPQPNDEERLADVLGGAPTLH